MTILHYTQVPIYGEVEHTEFPLPANASNGLKYFAMNLVNSRQVLSALGHRNIIYGKYPTNPEGGLY